MSHITYTFIKFALLYGSGRFISDFQTLTHLYSF